MARCKVVVMPGDGIVNQVMPEALRLLKAVRFDAEYVHADIGWEIRRKEGKVRTYDMMGRAGGPDVLRREAAFTTEMTDEILEKLQISMRMNAACL